MSIPGGDLTLLRSNPHTSDTYLVVQQPEYSTDGGSTWTGYIWSCRIDGAHTDDPTVTLTVDGGAAATDLLDGMTVLIGSAYGEWDSAICYVRGDQTVDGATVSLDIATSSEIRGHVSDDDFVVVLDEFQFRQRYGRITVAGSVVTWYKDYDIQWSDLGASDAARRLAMMPPTPVMGPHAVKFVEIGGSSAQFYFDWQDSYATAPSETVATWTSEGETNHAGGTWNSAAETPGWQTVSAISGLRGFRVTLEVDDGNGNATTLPYRRGVRYVFTLRRPGETQAGDPDNAEPIVDFAVDPLTGDFEQGYWRTSITVYASEATKYRIMPGALVILFTEDTYGTTAGSLGPITDRENILLVGRIVDGTIRENPETGDVTFDVASPGAEAATAHNYSIVIENNDEGTTWIETPDLTVDRAVHYYTTWHTTLNLVADLYQTGDTTEVYAQDYLEGDIYGTLNQFLYDRLFARLLCDKYGRFHCEVDAQEQAFGSVTTLWTLAAGDWLDEVSVRHRLPSPVNGVECGGIIYSSGQITPKLSHAPGLFDRYRGSRQASTSLAIASQTALNTSCGRHLAALNHEYEADFSLAGNWRYCDIAPQRVVDIGSLETERGTLTGDYIIRSVTNTFDPQAGVIFTDIQTEQEADDGVAGVTIDIPEDLPTPTRKPPKMPVGPGLPPLPGWPGPDTGRRIVATDVGVFVTDGISATNPVWYGANSGFVTSDDSYVWSIARDPFHWWTSGGTERTLWCLSNTGIWKHEDFPSGTWVQQVSHTDLRTNLGLLVWAGSYTKYGRIAMSIETDGRYAVAFQMDYEQVLPFPSSATGAFVAVCQDAGINNTHTFWGGPAAHFSGYQEVLFDPTGASQIIYAAPCRDPNNVVTAKRELHRTANGGAAWALVDGPYTHGTMSYKGSISIPYEDGGSSILWCSNLVHRISTDGSASFSDVTNLVGLDLNGIGTSSRDDRMWAFAHRPDVVQCRYTINSGTTWTTAPLMATNFECLTSWTYWQGDSFRDALIGGVETGGAPGPDQIFYWSAGTGSWSEKTSNLPSLGVSVVYDIDRDSMGSA